MGYFYFPKKENLRPLCVNEIHEIKLAVSHLKSKLPWKIYNNINEINFYEDKGMTDGILGYTKWIGNNILLAPDIVKQLVFRDKNFIPNNELAISIVIHELTHRQQMGWVFGLIWPILNIPAIDVLTVESWAKQNQFVTVEILSDNYNRLRKEKHEE